MTYTPRGKVAQIIELMATEPDREWTRDELATVAGLIKKPSAIGSYLGSAKKAGLFHTRKNGRDVLYRINPYEDEPPEPVEFKVAVWSDGDVVLYGAPMSEEGCVIFKPEHIEVLRRMLGKAA